MLLGLDIGGTAIKWATGQYQSGKLSIDAVNVSALDAPTLSAITQIVARILTENPGIDTVGISTSGSVSRDGTVLRAGLFRDYAGTTWSKVLGHMHGITHVTVLNDGQAAALAEFNALDGTVGSLCHFVVGTGVGGGAIVDGRLLRGDSGFAGAFGHLKVAGDGADTACTCGASGCLQAVASGRHISKSILDRGVDMPLADISSMGHADREIVSAELASAGYWIGRAAASIANAMNPAAITVGGGILNADMDVAAVGRLGPLMIAAREEFGRSVLGLNRGSIQIEPGRLRNVAGVHGALWAATRSVFSAF